MSNSTVDNAQVQNKEVSESAYEYLLGEILSLKTPKSADPNSQVIQRLDSLGYDVGYR